MLSFNASARRGQRLDEATDPDLVERHLAPVRRLYWLASHEETRAFVMDPGAYEHVFEVLTMDWPTPQHEQARLTEQQHALQPTP